MNKDVYIIDNLLPSRLENNLEGLLLSYNFDWYYQTATSYLVEDRTNDVDQFTHQFISKDGAISNFWSEANIILAFVEKEFNFTALEVLRAKANLLTINRTYDPNTCHPMHLDADDDDYWSILYYVNDSDGDTFFRLNSDIKRVTPKKGRIVFFPSNIEHASSSPTEYKTRSVINIITRIKKND